MAVIRFAPVVVLLFMTGAAQALPAKQVYDDDLALRRAGFDSVASVLLPVGAATAAEYAVEFRFDLGADASFAGDFDQDGIPDIVTFRPVGDAPAALGFRLIVATAGEARNTVVNIPYVTESEGMLGSPIDPSAIALLLPAVQIARNDGGGGTCEPPPEPVCEPPADQSDDFEPVDWLVFDFGEPLYALDIVGNYLFEPRATDFGANDIALEIHYLNSVAVEEPATAMLVFTGAALLALRRFGLHPGARARVRAARPGHPPQARRGVRHRHITGANDRPISAAAMPENLQG